MRNDSRARERALLEEGLRQALRAGARRAEVFLLETAGRTVEYTGRGFETYRGSASAGFGVRAFTASRTGFAWGQELTPAALRRVASRAVEAAGLADQRAFPTPRGGAAPGDLGIRDVAGLAAPVDDDCSRLERVVAAALAAHPSVRRVKKAALRSAGRRVRVLSTTGTDLEHERTAFSLVAAAVAEGGHGSEMGWDSESASFRDGLSGEEVGRRAGEKAAARLGAARADGGRRAVLLDREVVAEFLGLLASTLSADAVLKGKSLYAGKVGTKQAAGCVTIADDPQVPGAVGSAPFDDEGQRTRRTALLEAGVLAGYLHSLDTAHRMRAPAAGNGFRAGFDAPPQPRPSNIVLEPGTEAPERLRGPRGRVLVVDEVLGAHTMNPVSGDFSVGAAGFEVSARGRRPFRGATVAGNIRSLLLAAEAVGNDRRFFGNVGAASLLVRDLDVSA